MSGLLARRDEADILHLVDEESDDDLMEQMAIKMAALLPNDEQQAARVLTLVRSIYDVLTESREQDRAH